MIPLQAINQIELHQMWQSRLHLMQQLRIV